MKRVLQILFLITSAMTAETRDKPDLFGPKEENHTLGITAKVLTEEGKPLEGAKVQVAIENHNDFKDGSNDIFGKSDKEGVFSTEGVGRPVADIRATKEGYYPSEKLYADWGDFEEARKTGKYLPWNPVVELKLKKIGKPIPMIVRLKSSGKALVTPAPGEEVGYDFFEDDWVAPYGKGKISDLFITLTLKNNDVANISGFNPGVVGNIRFGNKADGLISIMELTAPESLLKYPRLALENGYLTKLVKPTSPILASRDSAEIKEPVGYMFRIRTQRDKLSGKIISAFYGKIVAPTGTAQNVNPFEVYSFPKDESRLNFIPYIGFSYYLNPTANDRNIEFDQHNNLAPEAIKGSVYPP